MTTTFVFPTSINDPTDATGLGQFFFDPYTFVHTALPGGATDRGAWAMNTAYAQYDIVTALGIKWVVQTAHTSTAVAGPSYGTLSLYKPLFNSGNPIYFPGHPNWARVDTPVMIQFQDDNLDITNSIWPDIGQAMLWWLAYGWDPASPGTHHGIVDYRLTRCGTIGNPNIVQLRGPGWRYPAEYGFRWGLGDDYYPVDTYNNRLLDWPRIVQFNIEDLNIDFNGSRIIQNDSRWNTPTYTTMWANTTSDREEYPPGTSLIASLPFDQIQQISTNDRAGKPLTLDPAWASTVSPGGYPINHSLPELEVFGDYVDSTHIHIDQVYQFTSQNTRTARYFFTAIATNGSPWITNVSVVPNPDWVGVPIQGPGLGTGGSVTVVAVDLSNPGGSNGYRIQLSQNLSLQTGGTKTFSLPYVPVELTRALEGRTIQGNRPDLLPASWPLFDPQTYISRIDVSTRIATLKSRNPVTQIAGDLDPTVMTTDPTTWVVTHLNTVPQAGWVGKAIGAQNTTGNTALAANSVIAAIDASNPSNYKLTLSKRPTGTALVAQKAFNVSYDDGPVNATFNNYGGYGFLWLAATSVLSGGSHIAAVDPTKRTIGLYDSTPGTTINQLNAGSRALQTTPYFIGLFTARAVLNSNLLAVQAPTTPIDSSWIGGEVETFADGTYGTRPTVATVTAVGAGVGTTPVTVSLVTTSGSAIAQIASYAARSDGMSYTTHPQWLTSAITGANLQSATTITEIGPNGTDLPTANHVRLSKTASGTATAPGATATVALANLLQVSTNAVKTSVLPAAAVRSGTVKRAALDVTLPVQFGMKNNGVQMWDIDGPGCRPWVLSPRDPYAVGVTPFPPRATAIPGTSILSFVQAKYVNSWLNWTASAVTAPWWYGPDPAWVGTRGISDIKGIVPYGAKITAVDTSNPANVTITIDKTIGSAPGTTFRGAWSSATAYATGDTVTYNNGLYQAVQANTNIVPTNVNSWTQSYLAFYVDDTPRTRITQRCRAYDSRCTTDGGLDPTVGGFEGDNGRYGIYWDCYDDSANPPPGVTYQGSSIFFQWHACQYRNCANIELDHAVVVWPWADSHNFGQSNSGQGGSVHPLAPNTAMQPLAVHIHDVYHDGAGRQHLTLQGQIGLEYDHNTSRQCQRWWSDNESTSAGARSHDVRIHHNRVDCGGSGDWLSVVPAYMFGLPPKKITNLQLTAGSNIASITPSAVTATNCISSDWSSADLQQLTGGAGLAAGSYLYEVLTPASIMLSAPAAATATVDIIIRDPQQLRDMHYTDNTIAAGEPGMSWDAYPSKNSNVRYSTVAVYCSVTAGSAIGHITSYPTRDDGTSYTLNSSWLKARLLVGPGGGGYIPVGTTITEVGPNGTDLPTSSDFRMSKTALTTAPDSTWTTGLLTYAAVFPIAMKTFEVSRNCSISPALFSGATAGQTAVPNVPMFCFGRQHEGVTVQDNIYPATPGGSNQYLLGWRSVDNNGSTTWKYYGKTGALVDGPPPGRTWTKSGNYFPNGADNDVTPSATATVVLSVDANPHPATGNITYTATITTSDSGQAAGSIVFYLDTDTVNSFVSGNRLGVAPIVSNVASFTAPAPAAGIYYLYAMYTGGCPPVKYQYSQVGPLTLNVGSVSLTSTTTTLAAVPSSPSTASTPITLTATVSPNPGVTGTVVFADAGTTIATVPVAADGTATLSLPSGLSIGTHPLTAQFTGTSTYAGSSSSVLNYSSTGTIDTTPPNVTFQSPAPGASAVSINTPIQFIFNEPTSNVVFELRHVTDGSLVQGTMAFGFGVYQFTPNVPLTPGDQYTATIVGAQDAANPPNLIPAPISWSFTTSGLGLVVASAANPTPPTPAPGPLLTATLTEGDGSTPGGIVNWTINGASVGSSTLPGSAPNVTTFQCPPLGAGTYSVVAHYTGQTGGQHMWIQQSEGSGLLTTAMIDSMIAMGAHGIRMSFDMASVYPTSASFTNDTPQYGTDATLLLYAKAHGLKVLMCLTFTPTWLEGQYHQCPRTTNGMDTFAEMCRRIVRDYGFLIDAYEIWNEANLDQFNASPTVASYRLLLRKTVLAMRSASPTAFIMNSGPASTGSSAANTNPRYDTGYSSAGQQGISQGTFLAGLFDASTGIVAGTTAGTPYLDAYAIHAYTMSAASPLAPSFENCFYHVGFRMAGIGDPAVFPNGFAFWDDILCPAEGYGNPKAPPQGAKQVWVTEAGLPSAGTAQTRVWNESQQAVELAQTWSDWNAYPFAGPYCYFQHTDNVNGGDLADLSAGLHRSNGTAKPAKAYYTAFAQSSSTASPVDSSPYTLTVQGGQRYYGGKTIPG